MTLAYKLLCLIDSQALCLVGQLTHLPMKLRRQFETPTSAKHTLLHTYIWQHLSHSSAVSQNKRFFSQPLRENESVYHKTCMQTVHIIRSGYLMELRGGNQLWKIGQMIPLAVMCSQTRMQARRTAERSNDLWYETWYGFSLSTEAYIFI